MCISLLQEINSQMIKFLYNKFSHTRTKFPQAYLYPRKNWCISAKKEKKRDWKGSYRKFSFSANKFLKLPLSELFWAIEPWPFFTFFIFRILFIKIMAQVKWSTSFQITSSVRFYSLAVSRWMFLNANILLPGIHIFFSCFLTFHLVYPSSINR